MDTNVIGRLVYGLTELELKASEINEYSFAN